MECTGAGINKGRLKQEARDNGGLLSVSWVNHWTLKIKVWDIKPGKSLEVPSRFYVSLEETEFQSGTINYSTLHSLFIAEVGLQSSYAFCLFPSFFMETSSCDSTSFWIFKKAMLCQIVVEWIKLLINKFEPHILNITLWGAYYRNAYCRKWKCPTINPFTK